MHNTLLTPLDKVITIAKKHYIELQKNNIVTVQDLLSYFPREYEDRSNFTDFANIRADQTNILIGEFLSVHKEKTRNNFQLVKAQFRENTSQQIIECVWFNARGIDKTLPLHQKVMISAKAKLNYGKISLQTPKVQKYEGEISEGLFPIYPTHSFITEKWFFRKLHEELIPQIHNGNINIPNVVPSYFLEKFNLLNKKEALLILHYPKDKISLKKAQNSLAFEELFVLQLVSLYKKQNIQNAKHESCVQAIPLNACLMKDFFKTLPFTPTNAQKISIFEILKDYEKPIPMQRLLEGDVGSGKTLVAMCAILPLILEGYQACIIAPTEILAKQLFRGITEFLAEAEKQDFFKKYKIKKLENNYNKNSENKPDNTLFECEEIIENNHYIQTEFLSGSIKGKKREKLLEKLRTNQIQILVGTHAILEDPVIFHHLGLAIVDEQHRFGVMQREKLLQKASPHFLQMSATPIPRSLAIVAFGDMDLSVLNELPPGRQKIETKVITETGRRTIELFIDDQIEKGRQAFVICPLVETSESEGFEDLRSVEEEFIRLSKHIFPHRKVAILHGKMKSKEKDEIMMDFKNKEYDILVATSVVEVGVDVPNATIMIIEGAERFGLSQLHQFRGRVGRGTHKSYCFLLHTKSYRNQRLSAMETTQNGFELAEMDMKMRGTGEIFGLKQSGIPDLKMANLMDGRKIVDAKESAEEFIHSKDSLESHLPLKYAVEARKKSMLSQ
ncbi:TPA: ATP-dependent DNA helicase RecG [Candidatus Gracilibacteria bacterium]|nr:ATP-dependent DNA helicase RecG [Candidatus Peregrinibacteria bacterium]HIQ56622.1 ATP-dependent DNA helicase RecG [Candidatus Gracilibacteria bacterium]